MDASSRRILIAVDESEEAARAVRYVGGLLAGTDGVEVRLLHLVSPDDAGLEEGDKLVVEGTPEAEQAGEAMKDHARDVLKDAFAILAEAGLPAEAAEAEVRTSPVGVDVARDCLDAARGNGCGTIVIGRSSLGTLAELFHDHPSDDLVRRAEGVAVWVVA